MASENASVNVEFQAYCPDCMKTVVAFLLPGSLERLQKNELDVEVGHYMSNTHVRAHKWILVNHQDRDDLRRRLAERRSGR